jgi:TonB family protein
MQLERGICMLAMTANWEAMMLRTLLESRGNRSRRLGGTAISVGVHTAVIGLAIAATARATSAPPLRVDPPPVIYVKAPMVTPQVEHRAHSTYEGIVPSMGRVIVEHWVFPTEKSRVDYVEPAIDTHAFDSAQVGFGAAAGSGRERGLVTSDSIYTAPAVDKAVMPHAGNPVPAYPPSLRAASIEGSVVARFVVDTAGRAEPKSITFAEATHPLFADAVRQALLRSRYLPALVDGRPVRQLVEQRFAFALNR